MTHAIKCGKALMTVKKKAGHGGWKSLFVPPTDGEKGRFDWRENRPFDFNWTQAKSYLKVATYPTLARTALLEDDGERFNLDRIYAALSVAFYGAEARAIRQATLLVS